MPGGSARSQQPYAQSRRRYAQRHQQRIVSRPVWQRKVTMITIIPRARTAALSPALIRGISHAGWSRRLMPAITLPDMPWLTVFIQRQADSWLRVMKHAMPYEALSARRYAGLPLSRRFSAAHALRNSGAVSRRQPRSAAIFPACRRRQFSMLLRRRDSRLDYCAAPATASHFHAFHGRGLRHGQRHFLHKQMRFHTSAIERPRREATVTVTSQPGCRRQRASRDDDTTRLLPVSPAEFQPDVLAAARLRLEFPSRRQMPIASRNISAAHQPISARCQPGSASSPVSLFASRYQTVPSRTRPVQRRSSPISPNDSSPAAFYTAPIFRTPRIFSAAILHAGYVLRRRLP